MRPMAFVSGYEKIPGIPAVKTSNLPETILPVQGP
jgi:hypothetical protein